MTHIHFTTTHGNQILWPVADLALTYFKPNDTVKDQSLYAISISNGSSSWPIDKKEFDRMAEILTARPMVYFPTTKNPAVPRL